MTINRQTVSKPAVKELTSLRTKNERTAALERHRCCRCCRCGRGR